jgi:outer membrane biosynthesis protein TonB
MSRVKGTVAGAQRLGLPFTLSALLHGSLAVGVILASRTPNVVMPPIYRVELVAAPPGPPAIGTVTESPPAPEATTPPPRRAESQPKQTVPVKRPPPARRTASKATPTPDAKSARHDTPAPKAAGGAQGGKGADVANVSLPGIEFPYPAYLQNIVRQVRLRFNPRNAQSYRAEVAFVIRRDGSVTGITIRSTSGNYAFDVAARGAIESAGTSGAFGALPDDFRDDALSVIFSFDPQLIR